MPVGEALAATYLAAGWLFLGASRWTRDPWRWLGIGAAAATAFAVARDGIRWEVIAGPVTGSAALAAAALGTHAWAEALGLPRAVALFSGVGLVSRPLRFSSRLRELGDACGSALTRAQDDPPSRDRQLRAAQRTTDAMARLRAPDEDWAVLRDDLVAQYRRWIELLPTGDARGLEAANARLAAIFERWAGLKGAASEQQRELATPARRRRDQAVWFAIAGVSAILIGLAQARAAWLQGGHDPVAVLAALGMIVIGVVACGYAAKFAVTR